MNNSLRGGFDFGQDVIGGCQQCHFRCCGGECGGIHRPLLGGTRSTMRTNIVAIVNDTTKDIIKIFSILCFYFVIFSCFDHDLIRKTIHW